MKQKRKIQQWIQSVLFGLALAGSTSLGWAATALTNDFNSDIAGWVINYGTGSVARNPTNGPDGSGCLVITLDASSAANNKVGPLVNPLPTPFSTADYGTIEYDIMIDPASGTDAGGSYGNWQEVLRDAGWSFDSHWVGALGGSYNSWTHRSFAVPNNAKTYPMLGFELGGTAPYTTNVVVYIDNVIIRPFENPLVAGTFPNLDEAATWTSGGRASVSFSILEATGAAPPGSLQVDVAYDDTTPGGWQEGTVFHSLSFSPERYTYAAFDLYVENPNALPGPGLGQASLFLNTGGWTSAGTIPVNTNLVGKWTHVEFPMPTSASASQLIFQFGSTSTTNALRYYLDNVKFYKPNTPSQIAIAPAGAAGVQINLSLPNNQWQREAIASPSGESVLWAGAGAPVTYSFTIAEFPDPVVHEGFEAHLYLVNGDTTTAGNQTYGGCDWNVADIAIMSISSITNDGGRYNCQFQWKTNSPNANPLDDAVHRPGSLQSSTILGTWSLTFTDNTNVTMSGPGGISTNFFMSEEAVSAYFNASTSFLQFGFHKNDNENNGHNDNTRGIFGRVQKTGGSYVFDDTFNGATLTNNYVWRKTLESAVVHVPPGTAWLVNWTLPADGHSVVSSPAVDGPYQDAGVVNIYQSGTKMYGQIPAAALPPGNAAFFGLTHP